MRGAIVLVRSRRVRDADREAGVRRGQRGQRPHGHSRARTAPVSRCSRWSPGHGRHRGGAASPRTDERSQSGSDVVRELKQVFEAIVQVRTQAPSRSAVRGQVWKWVAGILVAALTGFSVWVMGAGSNAGRPASRSCRSTICPATRNRSILPTDDGAAHCRPGQDRRTSRDLADFGHAVQEGTEAGADHRAGAEGGRHHRGFGRARRRPGAHHRQAHQGLTGDIIWARSYERSLRDVLSLQSEVARTITREVGITLTPQEQTRLASTRTVDPEYRPGPPGPLRRRQGN